MSNESNMSDLRFVYITAASAADAERVGRHLVESRLAACANILAGARSIFRWQGKIDTCDEAVLVCKTTVARMDALIAAVKATHGYEVPCVVALPILEANPDYAAWVRESVGEPQKT